LVWYILLKLIQLSSVIREYCSTCYHGKINVNQNVHSLKQSIMKIEKVEAFLMSYPMPEPVMLPFWGGLRTIVKRDAMLIRISTDTELVGYAPGPAHERALREINGGISEFLLGRNPLDWKEFNFAGGPELTKTYHACEVAVIDLAAKYEDVPVSELMGGRKRDRIKLYGSAGMYMSPEEYAGEAAAVREMGFRGYKMRPARGPEQDLRTVGLMRDACGEDMAIMIDAHTWWRMGHKSYSPEIIAGLAKSMSAYQPCWLEEPLPPEDHNAYRELKDRGYIPIASGEHEQELAGFEDLAVMKAVDFLQMDVCCQGGFEMGLKVFDLAAENHLKFAFHSWGTMLEVLAAAQLGVCRGEEVVEWLEYPCYAYPDKKGMYPFPLSDEILSGELEISDGYLRVPDTPGLGMKINEDVIHKYPFIPGPWSFFYLESPRKTIAVTGDHSIKWLKN
jgi:L-alanine-DL-glutamate epimerase-like enolase superfamily enzyme